MGSFIAQSFLSRQAGQVSALILSASNFAGRIELFAGHWLAAIEGWRTGKRTKSHTLNKMGFGDFNKRFAPNRTPFDWLSRDDDEVDRYAADPLCGFQCSNRLWFDLTGGLGEVTSVRTLAKIPADLPILITGGSDDAVGGRKGLPRLADAFRRSGHTDVTLKIYDGGRHEMLNETNRDEFTADLIDFIENSAKTTATGSE
jgi:alpha-beta hydrolase superfamily lysophospholipase